MNVQAALASQYHASMRMLKKTIDASPDDLWTSGEEPIPFWHVTYHALFYTHLYLSADEASFRPWAEARGEAQFFGPLPWPPHREPKIAEPYTRDEMLRYCRFVDAMVDEVLPGMDLDAPECGFPWYRLPKLDHQVNNTRHVQHHTATLSARLRRAAGIDIEWEA